MATWISDAGGYCWTGPMGWTICRVVQGGRDTFELWERKEQRRSECHRHGLSSLEDAQRAHLAMTGDDGDYAEAAAAAARMEEAQEIINPVLAAFMAGKTLR